MIVARVTGEEAAARHLADVSRRASDARPATTVVRKVLQDGLAKNFESRGAHFGASWPELAEGTVRRKGHSRPLEASGDLAAALSGGRGKRSSSTRRRASAGVSRDLFYARFAKGTKHQPARPIIGASAEEHAKALAVVRQYVLHGKVAVSVTVL